MEKLDRLGWADGLNVVSYGVRIGVRTNRPEVLERVAALLPPGSRPAAGPVSDRIVSVLVGGPDPGRNVRRFHLLYSDALMLARTHDLEEALGRLADHLQLYVAEAAPRRVFLHAGVVGWRGGAIVLPGVSYSGKSTLVAALVAAGATYYSDEYAVLDGRGRVHPFPRALQSRAHGGTRSIDPEALGGAGTDPLPVRLVAALRYSPRARWRPRRLTAGAGVLEMLAHAVPARGRPREVLATLRRVASVAPVITGGRAEAAEAAQRLLATLDGAEGVTR